MNIQVQQVMTWYPRIYFACHTRHVRDEEQNRVISAHLVSVLDHLDEVDSMGLLELAAHMGVTPSTMSITVDRLERGGYLSKTRSTADKRRVNLTLTAAGSRIRAKHTVLDNDRVADVLKQLSPDERKQALQGLELLARAADELMARQSRQKKESDQI
jgi:DNA-binding MarR family transcriptional regulator